MTVSGGVEYPGVYEVAMGMTLGAIIDRARPLDDIAAVLTGGFGGAWVGTGALDTPYAPGAMACRGRRRGRRGPCGPHQTRLWDRRDDPHRPHTWPARAPGQCGPCVFGLPAVADDLLRLSRGSVDPGALVRLEMRVASVEGRGACRHPDGVARMVRSALSVFATDAAAPCGRATLSRFAHEPSSLAIGGHHDESERHDDHRSSR